MGLKQKDTVNHKHNKKEIYKEENDVIAILLGDDKRLVLEQLAVIKDNNKDYFVMIPFIKDKTQIRKDGAIPTVIGEGITIGEIKTASIIPLVNSTFEETSIKERIFAIFKQNSKDKYNFPDNESMKFSYKEKEIESEYSVINKEINEIREKIAINKAQILKDDTTPEEIHKLAKDICELSSEWREKLNWFYIYSQSSPLRRLKTLKNSNPS